MKWKSQDIITLMGEPTADDINAIQSILKSVKKAKVYIKNPNEAPQGVKVETGPQGGYYYESSTVGGSKYKQPISFESVYLEKIKNGTGNELFNRDEHERHFVLDNTKDINIINFFTNDPDMGIRWKAAHRCDMQHLHKLIKDKNNLVRIKVAERIDQAGLHEMLMQNDLDNRVNIIIAQRIDLKGLEYIKEILESREYNRLRATQFSEFSKIVNDRLPTVRFLIPTIDNFQKTGQIVLDEQFKNYINDIMKHDTKSTIVIETTDEFYNMLSDGKFNEFHLESKSDWESSSSSNLALLLKDSVKRQFGGEIRYHDAVKDMEAKIQELQSKYPQELVDNYVKVQKQLTRAYLDVMYPDTDEITIHRGTTRQEFNLINGYDVESDENKVLVKSNSLSSWTLKPEVAEKFARGQQMHGFVLSIKIPKDEIWSTFMSHAYMGNEREILTIGKDREVYCRNVKPESEPQEDPMGDIES